MKTKLALQNLQRKDSKSVSDRPSSTALTTLPIAVVWTSFRKPNYNLNCLGTIFMRRLALSVRTPTRNAVLDVIIQLGPCKAYGIRQWKSNGVDIYKELAVYRQTWDLQLEESIRLAYLLRWYCFNKESNPSQSPCKSVTFDKAKDDFGLTELIKYCHYSQSRNPVISFSIEITNDTVVKLTKILLCYYLSTVS